MAHWTFLTHHAHVLVEVAKNPDLTVEQIAQSVGISSRATVSILNDLVEGGYVDRQRRGRRNHYVIHDREHLRHPANSDHTLRDLIGALTALPAARHSGRSKN